MFVQPERTSARQNPPHSSAAVEQRGEFFVALSVVVGLLVGESSYVTVCAAVKSTPNTKWCSPGRKRVGRKPGVSSASTFLVPYGTSR
jgi:hypothetical protein